MTVDPHHPTHVARPHPDHPAGSGLRARPHLAVVPPVAQPAPVAQVVPPAVPVAQPAPMPSPQIAAPIPALHDQLAIARMDADARSRLAQAEILLAEARLRCAQMVDEARAEAHAIISNARAAAQRMQSEMATRHAQVMPAQPGSRSSFSELWAIAEQEHDVDDFFLAIPERAATEVFNA